MNIIDDGYYVVPKWLPSCGSYHGSSNHYKFYSGRLQEEEEKEDEEEEGKKTKKKHHHYHFETELVFIRQVEVAFFKGNFKEKDKAQTLEHVPQGDRR